MKASNHRKCGLTLVEVLIVVSILGIVSSIAISRTSLVYSNAEQTKLQQDVKHLNSAVKIYLANGGSFDGVSNPQEVLDRMKAGFSGDAQNQFVGISGATVDKRLAARTDSSPSKNVAVWSEDKNEFIIVENLDGGISEFYLDEALEMKTYEPVDRQQSIVTYSDSPGWIWDFAEQAATVGNAPTVVATSETADSVPPPIPVRLEPPVFSTAAGPYLETEYPLPIILSNPNDPATWMMVSINGDPFFRYESPITLSGPGTVLAYANGDPTYWISSADRSGSYTQAPPTPPIQLLPPLIDLSAPAFTDDVALIDVAFTNPNILGSSSIYYSIVDQAVDHPPINGWQPLSGPISASVIDYPEGFKIAAYSRTTDDERFTSSAESTAFTTSEFYNIPVRNDVLFVVDASGSMGASFRSSTRFETTIDELVDAIERLPETLKFNVGMFDADIHWTDGTFRLHDATEENKNSVISQIRTVSRGSGTNYAAALQLPTLFDPMPSHVILLSDGEPNSTPYNAYLESLASMGIRIDAIGLDLNGSATDTLEGIVDLTGGILEAIADHSSGGKGGSGDDD